MVLFSLRRKKEEEGMPQDAGSSNSSSGTVKSGRRRWSFEEGGSSLSTNEHKDLVPPGYLVGAHSHYEGSGKVKMTAEEQEQRVKASAMAVATAPGKNMFMTMFMLWMSGSSLQIFSIMMLCMAFWTPLQGIMNVQKTFARYDDSNVDLLLQKLIYIALNLAAVGVALYKCNTMGLLPTAAADWIVDVGKRPGVEFSGGSIL